ncbi:MAG: hypothetical protein ASARMPREDX12_004362 [Alectoria sarmentosa]|nr:MAG: hypothetical protein ASARMPRED_003681 [Alectoria sarmentosa]CAD6590427.1 MAG: hypothetical protein ASARMPREDX12_004362 [Alectoria sarmentosa]
MAGKRKRADTLGVEEIGGGQMNGAGQVNQQEKFREWLADIMEILRDQDTTPSTFDHPISTSIQESHDAKRTKLSDASEKTTVATLIKSNAYTSIEEFIKDVDCAISSITEQLQEKISAGLTSSSHQIAHAEISRARAVKIELDKLVLREIVGRPETIRLSKGAESGLSDEQDAKTSFDGSGNNVLTLLGNMGSGRTGQLFTSLRKPNTSDEPLNEAALPNGITATKIVPIHSISNTEDKKQTPTLGERFPPPASLLPLPLPKQSRHTATRSSSVNWYNPTEAESKSKSGRRDGYTTQPLPTGQWLTYNAAPSSTQLVSPESKRKQRDRALSIGEPQTSISQEAIDAHNQAKEDALFRSVYSSFAPNRDDSGAIVAEQQKNRFWWRKHGEQRYRELLGIRDAGLCEAKTKGVEDEDAIDEREIQEAIRTWEPEETPQEMNLSKIVSLENPETSKEADAVLSEISDLLETLDSHQRVRNLTLAANARTAGGQNPQSTALSGTPTSPSSAEFDVYEVLKAQLTLIVSTLPPYLVAKLDGDKLGALNISTKLQVESKNQKGTMESDESAAAARPAARPAATPGIPQAASAYTNAPTRSSNYVPPTATPVQRYQQQPGYSAQTAPRQPSNSGYLQNPQYSNRPASYNYSAGARPTYPPQSQPTSQRAASSSTYAPQYGQQSSQSFGSYQHGYRGYSGVGQNGGNYNYNQQYSTPQARPPNSVPPPQAYRGSQTDYQQRAVPPQGYGYGSAPAAGSASPHQQRSSFSAPGPTAPPQRPTTLYHAHSSQYNPPTPGSPLVNGARSSGSPTQQGHLTADEQAALMARQKAQLAERQGSGTPQPPTGQYGQQGGTPVPQPNGVAA